WELSLLYPFVPLEELIVQYVKMDRNSINKKNTALVIAIEKKHIKLIKNFCIKNNLSLRYVDSSMIAANRLFNSMEELTSKGLTLNILTVSNSFSFTLNVSRKPAYVRIFQVAKNKKVSDILADELNSSNLKNIKTELANEAYISGDGITAELISQLRIATGLNFKQLNPFKDSKVKQDLKNGNLIDEKYSSFTSAAGIAFRLI
ncbi:MAG: hypothetical protein KJO59_04265, partial [Ignavibacteria bacterium]|nr:hypothetical protein [Ignavibacteria bacterium]